jgi:hypothetical protein
MSVALTDYWKIKGQYLDLIADPAAELNISFKKSTRLRFDDDRLYDDI